MELSTKVAGLALEHPVMNAAGTCRTLAEVQTLARSATAAVMVGSITWEPREGNTGNTFWPGAIYSLNSLGLPNRGALFYRDVIPEMVAVAHGEGKPLFVSVAGFSPHEYADLTELAFEGGADLVELNLGCPNVWRGNVQKRIACFAAGTVADILGRVEDRVEIQSCKSVKLSPFSDPFALAAVAQVIGASSVNCVTTMNTFPNAFDFDGKVPRITPAGGLAGLAGSAVKPIGLGQVRQLRALLPPNIQIIGVGGISTGLDVLEYLECGAVAVQVGTAYLDRHEPVFGALLEEMFA